MWLILPLTARMLKGQTNPVFVIPVMVQEIMLPELLMVLQPLLLVVLLAKKPAEDAMLAAAAIIPATSIIVLPVMSVAPLVLVHWLAMPMEQDVLPAVNAALATVM